MKMRNQAARLLILILLGLSVVTPYFGQTPNFTPTPTPLPEISESDKKLIAAAERAQTEVKESRTRIELLKKREKVLENQVETEKENGRQAGELYRTATAELAEVRAALESAKKELKLREDYEKNLKKQIGRLKGELWLTRFGAGGIILALLYLWVSN